jgi:hypothetical protein
MGTLLVSPVVSPGEERGRDSMCRRTQDLACSIDSSIKPLDMVPEAKHVTAKKHRTDRPILAGPFCRVDFQGTAP